MNREIKFRAWDRVGKCMVDWFTARQTAFNINVENPLMYQLFTRNYQDISDVGFDLMQYTGLQDKYGIDIYEGDIVRGNWWSAYEYIGVIKFGETNGLHYDFYGWYVDYIDHNSHPSNDSIHDINTKFEVIGNIHQNPELLNRH